MRKSLRKSRESERKAQPEVTFEVDDDTLPDETLAQYVARKNAEELSEQGEERHPDWRLLENYDPHMGSN